MFQHAEIGMKCGKMEWDIWAELLCYPGCHFIQFRIGIILAGTQERGNFQLDIGFVFYIFQRVQNWSEMGQTNFSIESFIECFQIDIGCINVPVKFRPRLCINFSGGHCNGFQTMCVACFRDGDSIIL